MANSIFEKTEIVSGLQIWNSNFHISGLGPSHETRFCRNVWVHVLMLYAKYKED